MNLHCGEKLFFNFGSIFGNMNDIVFGNAVYVTRAIMQITFAEGEIGKSDCFR